MDILVFVQRGRKISPKVEKRFQVETALYPYRPKPVSQENIFLMEAKCILCEVNTKLYIHLHKL